MEAMCHTHRERKSKPFDKIKKKKKRMREGHMARRKVGGNFSLESSWMRFGGREGKMRKRK